mmetsp:Transcript_1156/g.1960  ORF Transcript_1156/g.1960 Transcript_1156/m.1960 type:complete len:250 (-) Transcript_1156:1212-1961(-)
MEKKQNVMRNKTDIKAVEARCDDGGYIIKETGRHHHATTIAPHAFFGMVLHCVFFKSINDRVAAGWEPPPPPQQPQFSSSCRRGTAPSDRPTTLPPEDITINMFHTSPPRNNYVPSVAAAPAHSTTGARHRRRSGSEPTPRSGSEPTPRRGRPPSQGGPRSGGGGAYFSKPCPPATKAWSRASAAAGWSIGTMCPASNTWRKVRPPALRTTPFRSPSSTQSRSSARLNASCPAQPSASVQALLPIQLQM